MGERQALLRKLNRRLRRRGVEPSRRQEILAEIRQGLDDAALEVGEAEAVRRFGDVAEVADELASVEKSYPRKHPAYRAGTIWAAVTLLLLFVLQVARIPTFGLVREFDPRLGGGEWQLSLWPLFRFFGDTNEGTVFDAVVGWPSYLIFITLAFVLGARLWRLLRNVASP